MSNAAHTLSLLSLAQRRLIFFVLPPLSLFFSLLLLRLRLVDPAVDDGGDLLRPPALPADVGHLVQGLDARHHVAEDAGELRVHVGQYDAELGCHLRTRETIYIQKRK